jgi:hypothetical protein
VHWIPDWAALVHAMPAHRSVVTNSHHRLSLVLVWIVLVRGVHLWGAVRIHLSHFYHLFLWVPLRPHVVQAGHLFFFESRARVCYVLKPWWENFGSGFVFESWALALVRSWVLILVLVLVLVERRALVLIEKIALPWASVGLSIAKFLL